MQFAGTFFGMELLRVKKRLVNWADVCKPKEEGGLNIKNLKSFNCALNLSQIWDLCSLKESIWVKWLHNFFMNGREFWGITENQNMSWQMKRILRLRAHALHCVQVQDDGALIWRGNENKFQTKGSYNLLAGSNSSVPWANWIWGELSPPKHSFCSWLAIQNKLRTLDRMPWMINSDLCCCWCKQVPETNCHIFFNCSCMQVLKPLLNLFGKPFMGNSWSEWISWRAQLHNLSKGEDAIISYITNAAIYETWRNRNFTIFRGKKENDLALIQKIWKLLSIKVHSVKHKAKWKSLQSFKLQPL